MTDSWPCPVCGAAVEDTGLSSRVGMGVEHPGTQHNHCGTCDVNLYRHTEAPERGWMVNRDDRSERQCRARLQALAAKRQLDFKDAYESSPGVWRCYLYERQETERGGRLALINGSDATAEGALQEAIYEAETKELL